MAEPFEKRAATALSNPLFRLADFPALIAEGQELAERHQVIASESAVEAVDFTLNESDRDEAAAKADRAGRNAAAIAAAVETLTAKLAERRASEKASKAEAERKAAIAERDELASRFSVVMPEALTAMTELFAQIEANAKRLKRAGLKEPNAEAKARGIKGSYGVDWFTAMKIPAWTGKGRTWPPMAARRDVHACVAEGQRKLQEMRAADDEASWGRYHVETDDVIGGCSFRARIGDTKGEEIVTIYEKSWEGMIRHSEANRLRKAGAIVEALDPVRAAAEPASEEPEFL